MSLKSRRALTRIDRHVAARVRARRLHLELTQEEVAAELKVSYQAYQKYEARQSRISAGLLWELSQLFKVDVSAFYQGLNRE